MPAKNYFFINETEFKGIFRGVAVDTCRHENDWRAGRVTVGLFAPFKHAERHVENPDTALFEFAPRTAVNVSNGPSQSAEICSASAPQFILLTFWKFGRDAPVRKGQLFCQRSGGNVVCTIVFAQRQVEAPLALVRNKMSEDVFERWLDYLESRRFRWAKIEESIASRLVDQLRFPLLDTLRGFVHIIPSPATSQCLPSQCPVGLVRPIAR